MATTEIREIVKVPQGVTLTTKDGTVTVKGKGGELSRAFVHPGLHIEKQADGLVVVGESDRKKTKALTGTWAAHLRNMIAGVQTPYEYKLKVVYSHFPIKVKVVQSEVVIENFLGGKTPRRAAILGASKVKPAGDEVIVTGPDVEAVGQTAANIEQACRVIGFDRKVFQDGIYITSKGA
ncbi:MAG: 50S ribosomal protein L6 [Thermoplasmatota archaeon]